MILKARRKAEAKWSHVDAIRINEFIGEQGGVLKTLAVAVRGL